MPASRSFRVCSARCGGRGGGRNEQEVRIAVEILSEVIEELDRQGVGEAGGEAVEVYSPDTGTWTLVDTEMRISGRVCSAGVIKMYALYGP